MSFEKYLPGLRSNDNFEVETTIDTISAIYDDEPTGEVRKLLLNYCSHEDPYIRRVAIRTTATHWAFTEAFEILAAMLTGPQEHDEVLDVICSSVHCYTDDPKISNKQISELYLAALENPAIDEGHRKMLYQDFLLYNGIINIKEYAAATVGVGKVASFEIDMDLVREKARKDESL